MTRSAIARFGVLVSTVALAWGALAVGVQPAGTEPLRVGDRAQRDYVARSTEEVEDVQATEAAREGAASRVATVFVREPLEEDRVFADLEEVLADIEAETAPVGAVTPPVPNPTTTTTTSPTTTAAGSEDDAAAEDAEEETPTATLTGRVFIDVDGDGAFDETASEGAWRSDFGLGRATIVAVSDDGAQFDTTTNANGSFSIEVDRGDYEVYIADGVPDGFGPTAEAEFVTPVSCGGAECEVEPVGLTPQVAPLEERVESIRQIIPTYSVATIQTLTEFAAQDLIRAVTLDALTLELVEDEADDRLGDLFLRQVLPEDVQDVKREARLDPSGVLIDGRSNPDAREAVNELVSNLITNNMIIDQAATEAAREEARNAVDPVTQTFRDGRVIVRAGEELDELAIQAIIETQADVDRTVRQAALGGVLLVLVAVLGYYLARFRRNFWERPRMVALLGMLIVLAAGAVRLTVQFQDQASTGYILPAVAFGYLAAVLFDNRMGTLMALAMAVLAAVGTGDPGLSVYAGLATLAPIGFVSSVSSRRAFRNSVLVSGVSAAVIAAACTWFFQADLLEPVWPQIWPPAAFAGVVSLFASLVALAAMPFFESMFDITTTLRLLELTDRNHEALQLIQEKAFGTFNHSLMVGTLADTAARSIGADNILARAAAYYHDIGKTENPTFFIENQFGIGNPHDELPPEESAQIIRQHVVDGIELARRHNIPSEVAEGIVAHHGDGIMRYFFEKARQSYGENAVDPDHYRHAGHKPRSREMAILMVADAVEGACRAVFGEEEPTPEAITKVVNRVVDEKVSDGQLSESALTLGELTRVRQAFIEALIGHYHQRIPYPNFPGS